MKKCFISLKTGTIIIGITSAIVAVLNCILWTVALVWTTMRLSQADFELGPIRTPYIVYVVSCSCSILLTIVQFSMAVVLVRGAHKENLKKFRFYLIYGIITLLLAVISAIVLGLVIPVTVSVAVNIFFLIMIWSYHKKRKAEGTNAGGIVYAPRLSPPGYRPTQPGYGPPPPGYAPHPPEYTPPATSPFATKEDADVAKM